MRSLIVANVEKVEATPFLVAILYGEDGQRLDEICLPFVSYSRSIRKIRSLGIAYRIPTIELWTSDNELYIEALKAPGIAAAIKHSSDTNDTRRVINRDYDLLFDLYDIQPIKPKLKASKWRSFLILICRKLLKRLGDGIYEI